MIEKFIGKKSSYLEKINLDIMTTDIKRLVPSIGTSLSYTILYTMDSVC